MGCTYESYHTVCRAAAYTKNTYLSSQYRRIAARRGSNRTALAVPHTMLVIVYNMVKHKAPYKDLGAVYFHILNEKAILKRTERLLNSLGYEIVK